MQVKHVQIIKSSLGKLTFIRLKGVAMLTCFYIVQWNFLNNHYFFQNSINMAFLTKGSLNCHINSWVQTKYNEPT